MLSTASIEARLLTRRSMCLRLMVLKLTVEHQRSSAQKAKKVAMAMAEAEARRADAPSLWLFTLE